MKTKAILLCRTSAVNMFGVVLVKRSVHARLKRWWKKDVLGLFLVNSIGSLCPAEGMMKSDCCIDNDPEKI